MSKLKTNLDEVLRRQNQNKANLPFTLTLSKPNSSRFKPVSASATSNHSASARQTLPSFSTPGFAKSSPNTSVASRPFKGQPLREAISISSDSDLSTPSNHSSKRASSGPSDLSPSPKRQKHGENKENEMASCRDKGKGRELPYPQPTKDVQWGNTSMENDPWKTLDRDFPPPSLPRSSPRSQSLPPTKYPDLAALSVSQLNTLLLYNMDERQRKMESIVNYYSRKQEDKGLDDSVDIVILQAIKDILEDRISAIKEVLRKRESGASRAATSASALPEEFLTPPLPAEQSSTHSTALHIESSSDVSIVETSRPPPSSQPLQYEPTLGEEDLWNSVGDIGPIEDTGSNMRMAVDEGSSESSSASFRDEVMRKLKGTFRLQAFRHHQWEAIEATLSGKDVFVLMPTGGGKSLCYQLPAVCDQGKTRGVTFVVSPLLALIADQVRALRAKGIDAVQWTSEESPSHTSGILHSLNSQRKPKLVYVTPEKLQASGATKRVLSDLYRSGNLARFVIDEAHCISTWGRDFREAYTGLNVLREEYPDVPIMALTATANQGAVKDIIYRLKIEGCVELVQSFNRKNLTYKVITKPKNVVQSIADFIRTQHMSHTGIIYCLARKTCEVVAAELRDKHNLDARHYHAQMTPREKEETQLQWQSGECLIIVATIAFGMGVDKPDVRFVVHHSLPKSLDGYYQETGRAGRDGLPADCLLYFSYADVHTLRKMFQESSDGTLNTPESIEHQEEGVLTVAKYCINNVQCRRVQILHYFDETFERKNCQRMCDNCDHDDAVSTANVTKEAKDMLRLTECLQDSNVAMGLVLDVYRGSKSSAVKKRGYEREALYGAGQHMNPALRDQLIPTLLAENALSTKYVPNAAGWNQMYLCIGPNAHKLLNGEQQLVLSYRVPATGGPDTSTRKGGRRANNRAAKQVGTSSSNLVEARAALFVDDSADPIEPPEDFDDEDVVITSSPKKDSWASVTHRRAHRIVTSPSVELSNIAPPLHPDPTFLLTALQARHKELRKKAHGGSIQEELIDQCALELIATLQPKDSDEFRDAVKTAAGDLLSDPVDLQTATDSWCVQYENALLQTINGETPSSSRNERTAATSHLNVTHLHQRFNYAAPARSVSTPESSASTTVRRAKFRPVSEVLPA